MSGSTFIYALCEPDTGEIRYIGKASNPERRLTDHLSAARRAGPKTWARCWIKGLLEKGQRPGLLLLEMVPLLEWEEWERTYIATARYFGMRLTNTTDGGDGVFNPSPEVRRKNSERQKGKVITLAQRAAVADAQRFRKAVGASSRYRGVYWHSGSKHWRAQICINGIAVSLKCYSSERDAAIAYDWAAKLFFTNPKLNFP